jgi:thymidylate synthase
MHVETDSVDELLRAVLRRLLRKPVSVSSSRGETSEVVGALLRLRSPRARLSRTEVKGTAFSCLGEFLWYLAGSNDMKFVSYYLAMYKQLSDDGRTIYGAYGPRLFTMRRQDQIRNVIRILRDKPTSRQAVVQLFDAVDLAKPHKDIPCTCTLQFLLRRGRLHMFTCMRSNDAFRGLPHDIFAFTMLQEIVARSVSAEVGTYMHAIGSLHLYENDRKGAQQFLDEGPQQGIAMPSMPQGDPWPAIEQVLQAEKAIRQGRAFSLEKVALQPYWADLVRLLLVFACFKQNRQRDVLRIKKQMSVRVYDSYIDRKRRAVTKRAVKHQQDQMKLWPIADLNPKSAV